MQGEVSYRESEEHSSSTSDLEMGTGANTSATTPTSTAAKKAMLVISVLLFIAACVMLVQLGNERPPPRYDSGSPNAPRGENDDETPNEPKQGRLETGGFLSNAQNGGPGRSEYENSSNDNVAYESEDVQQTVMWTTTTEVMEETTLIDSSSLEDNEFSLSTPDNMAHPTSPILSDSLTNTEVNEEMQSTMVFLPSMNSTSASMTNGTLMEDSTDNPFMGSTAAKSFIHTMPAWKDSTTGSEETTERFESSKIVADMNDGPPTERRKVLHMTDEAFTEREEKLNRFKIPIHYTKEYVKTSQMPFLMRKARSLLSITDEDEETWRGSEERRQTTTSEFSSTVTETSPSVTASSTGYAKSEEMSTLPDYVVTIPPTEDDRVTTLRTTTAERFTDTTQRSTTPSNSSSSITEISQMAQTNQPPLLSSEITTKVPLFNIDTVTTFKESTEVWRIPTDDSTIFTHSELARTEIASKIAEEVTEGSATQSSLNATELTVQNQFMNIHQSSTPSPETTFINTLEESSTNEDMVKTTTDRPNSVSGARESSNTPTLWSTSRLIPWQATEEDSIGSGTTTTISLGFKNELTTSPAIGTDHEISTAAAIQENLTTVQEKSQSRQTPAWTEERTSIPEFATPEDYHTDQLSTTSPESVTTEESRDFVTVTSTKPTNSKEAELSTNSKEVTQIQWVESSSTLLADFVTAPSSTDTTTVAPETPPQSRDMSTTFESSTIPTSRRTTAEGSETQIFVDSSTILPIHTISQSQEETRVPLVTTETTQKEFIEDEKIFTWSYYSTPRSKVTVTEDHEIGQQSTFSSSSTTVVPFVDITTLRLTKEESTSGTRVMEESKSTTDDNGIAFVDHTDTNQISTMFPTFVTAPPSSDTTAFAQETSVQYWDASTSFETLTTSSDSLVPTTSQSVDASTSRETNENELDQLIFGENSTTLPPSIAGPNGVPTVFSLSETTMPFSDTTTISSLTSTRRAEELEGSTASTMNTEIPSVDLTRNNHTSTLIPEFVTAPPSADIQTIVPDTSLQSTETSTSFESATEPFDFNSQTTRENTDTSTSPEATIKVSPENEQTTISMGNSIEWTTETVPSFEDATEVLSDSTKKFEEVSTEDGRISTQSELPRNTAKVNSTEDDEISRLPTFFTSSSSAPDLDVTTITSPEPTKSTTMLGESIVSTINTEAPLVGPINDSQTSTTLFPEFVTATQSQNPTIDPETSNQSRGTSSLESSTVMMDVDFLTTSENIGASASTETIEKAPPENRETTIFVESSTISLFGDTKEVPPGTTESTQEESIENGKISTSSELPQYITEINSQTSEVPPSFFSSATNAVPFIDITTIYELTRSTEVPGESEFSTTDNELFWIDPIGHGTSTEDNEINQSSASLSQSTTAIPSVEAATTMTSSESTRSTKWSEGSESSMNDNEVLGVDLVDNSQTSTLPPDFVTAMPSTDTSIFPETTTQSQDTSISYYSSTASPEYNSSIPAAKIDTTTTEKVNTDSPEDTEQPTFVESSTVLSVSTVPFSEDTKEVPAQTTESVQEESADNGETSTQSELTTSTAGVTSVEANKSSQFSPSSQSSTTTGLFEDVTTRSTTEESMSSTQLLKESQTSTDSEDITLVGLTGSSQISTMATNAPPTDNIILVQETSPQSGATSTSFETSTASFDSVALTTMEQMDTSTVSKATINDSEIPTLDDSSTTMPPSAGGANELSPETTANTQEGFTGYGKVSPWSTPSTMSSEVTSTEDNETNQPSTFFTQVTMAIPPVTTTSSLESSRSTNGLEESIFSTMRPANSFQTSTLLPEFVTTTPSTDTTLVVETSKVFGETLPSFESSTASLDSNLSTASEKIYTLTSTELAETEPPANTEKSTSTDSAAIWSSTVPWSEGTDAAQSETSQTVQEESTESTPVSTLPYNSVTSTQHKETPIPLTVTFSSSTDPSIVTSRDNDNMITVTESDILFAAPQSTEETGEALTMWTTVLNVDIHTTTAGSFGDSSGVSPTSESSTVAAIDTIFETTQPREETSDASTIWTTASDFGKTAQSTESPNDASTFLAAALDPDINTTTPASFWEGSGASTSTETSTIAVTDSVFRATQSTERASDASTLWTTPRSFKESSRGINSIEGSTEAVADQIFDTTQPTEGARDTSTIRATASDYDIKTTTADSFGDTSREPTATEASMAAVTETSFDASQTTEGDGGASTEWATELNVDIKTTTPDSIGDSSREPTSTETSTEAVTDIIFDTTESTETASGASTFWGIALDFHINTTTPKTFEENSRGTTSTESSTVAETDTIFDATSSTDGTSEATTFWTIALDSDVNATTPRLEENNGGLTSTERSTVAAVTDAIFDATQSTELASGASTTWTTASDFDVSTTTGDGFSNSSRVPTSTETSTVATTHTIFDATQSTEGTSDATTLWTKALDPDINAFWTIALDSDINATTPKNFEENGGGSTSTETSTVAVTETIFDAAPSTEAVSDASTFWTAVSAFGMHTTTAGSFGDTSTMSPTTESSSVTDTIFDATQSNKEASDSSTMWTTALEFNIKTTTPGSIGDSSTVLISTETSTVAVTDIKFEATESTEGAGAASTFWGIALDSHKNTTTPQSSEETSTVSVTDTSFDAAPSTKGTSDASTIWTTASDFDINLTTPDSFGDSSGLPTSTETSTAAVTVTIFDATQSTEGTSDASTIWTTASVFDIKTTTTDGFLNSSGVPTSTETSTTAVADTTFDATPSTEGASDATTTRAAESDFDINTTIMDSFWNSSGAPTSTETSTIAVTDMTFDATPSTEGASDATTTRAAESDFDINTTITDSFWNSSGAPTSTETSTIAVTETTSDATPSTEGTSDASTFWTMTSAFGMSTTTTGRFGDGSPVSTTTTDKMFDATQSTEEASEASTMWTTEFDFAINTTTADSFWKSSEAPTSTESSREAVTDMIFNATQSTEGTSDATTMWTTTLDSDTNATTPRSFEETSGMSTLTETSTITPVFTESGEKLGTWSTTSDQPGITQEISTPSQTSLYTNDNTSEEYPTTVEQSIWLQKSTTKAAQTDASTEDSTFTSYESSTETKDSTALTTLEFREISTSLPTTTPPSTDTTEAIQEVFTTDRETALPPESSSIFPPDISTLQSTKPVEGENITTEMDKESYPESTLMQSITTPMALGDTQTTAQEPSLTTSPTDSTQSIKDSILNSTLADGNTGTTEFDSPSTVVTGATPEDFGEHTTHEGGSTASESFMDTTVSIIITTPPQFPETTVPNNNVAVSDSTSSSWFNQTSQTPIIPQNYSTQSTSSFQSVTSTTPLQSTSITRMNKNISTTPSHASSTTQASTTSRKHTLPLTSTTAFKSIVSSTYRTTPVLFPFTQTSEKASRTKTTQRGRNCGPSFLNKPCDQSRTTISIEQTSETKKPMKVKTTTPMTAQSSSTKYFNRPISTTQSYHHYTFPVPPRPSTRQPKSQRPKNYYQYYLQRGHFPLCAAVLAFFRSFCDGFKHGFRNGFR